MAGGIVGSSFQPITINSAPCFTTPSRRIVLGLAGTRLSTNKSVAIDPAGVAALYQPGREYPMRTPAPPVDGVVPAMADIRPVQMP
ncbi:hypothetical protein D3C73_1132640 [compost metagenome]